MFRSHRRADLQGQTINKHLNVYFGMLDFREQCLGNTVRIKVRLIRSYQRLPPEYCPSGSALIIKKRSLCNRVCPRSVHYLRCSCIPKAQTPLTPDDHYHSSPRSPESAADNLPSPSFQPAPCHLSEQSPADATRHNRADVRGI